MDGWIENTVLFHVLTFGSMTEGNIGKYGVHTSCTAATTYVFACEGISMSNFCPGPARIVTQVFGVRSFGAPAMRQKLIKKGV